MIIEIHDVWDDARARHSAYLRGTALKRIRRQYLKWKKAGISADQAKVVNFIATHIMTIFSSFRKDYHGCISDFDRTFPAGSVDRDNAVDVLRKIFSYSAFRDSKGSWGAYHLCGSARYSVCPYCHLRQTETQPPAPGLAGYRPQLDHFFSQDEYPFLAVSLWNLVPSCGVCNGPNMKFTKNFMNPVHLNPLRDAAEIEFSLRPKSGTWSVMLIAMREAKGAYCVDVRATTIAAKNSRSTFQLIPQYQAYVHDAYRLAKVGAKNREDYRIGVKAAIGLEMTLEDELGFSPFGSEFKGVPQGRMKLDVYLDSLAWL